MACVALPGAGFVPGDVSGGDAVPPPVHGTVCPAFCFPGGMGAICVTRMQILEENKPGFLKEGRGLPIIGEAPAGEFARRVMVQGMLVWL